MKEHSCKNCKWHVIGLCTWHCSDCNNESNWEKRDKMDIEEAIEILINEMPYCKKTYYREEDKVEAYQMAIKALNDIASIRYEENNPCRGCPTSLTNGGDGICHCILGTRVMM